MTDIKVNNDHRRFEVLTQGMVKTFADKNSDYGNSFEDSLREYGPIAFLVRASDKWLRTKTLLSEGHDRKVSDEAIRDTLLDLANYCIMFVMWLDKKDEVVWSNTMDKGGEM